MLFEETPLPQTLRAELDATEDALVEVVARSLQGQPDIAEHHLVARVIVSAIEGLTHRLVLRPAGASPDAIAAEVTTMLRGYLQQRQRTLDSRNRLSMDLKAPGIVHVDAVWRAALPRKEPAVSRREPDPAASVSQVAPGVKQVSVGAPLRSHIYLIDGSDGPIAFDAGIKGSGPAILAAAGGRVERVILSHSHIDHRGAAGELGAPIYCHPDEVADAEGDAGRSYTNYSLIEHERVREIVLQLHARWDGGPVKIAGTIADGERVAGFRVVHIPGHAPGQIALFREPDRLLIAADAIYTLDAETGQPTSARVPHPFSNWDTEMARDSIRRLIPLDPTSVWTGHSDAVTGENVDEQLEQAADYGLTRSSP